MKVYKLTKQDMRTYGEFQWRLGRKRVAPGKGPLCSSGWLHCYSDPLLAAMIYPAQVRFSNPRFFVGEATGRVQDDSGLKLGVQKLTLKKEIPLPAVTTEQRVRFAILCALEVTDSHKFKIWADGWLSGKDRSAKSAWEESWANEAEAEAEAEAAWVKGVVTYWLAWDAANSVYQMPTANEAAAWAATRAAQAAAEAWVLGEAAAQAAAQAAVFSVKAGLEHKIPLDLISLARKAMKP